MVGGKRERPEINAILTAPGAVDEAFRFSPRDPGVGLWYLNIANAEFCLARYDAAVEDFNYRPYLPYAYWAAAAAMKGDSEAKWASGEAKNRVADLTSAQKPDQQFLDKLRSMCSCSVPGYNGERPCPLLSNLTLRRGGSLAAPGAYASMEANVDMLITGRELRQAVLEAIPW